MYSGLLAHAARVIRQGGLVAYPTESCYGIGCDPRNIRAVKRLLKLKKRPTSKGLILIASTPRQLAHYVSDISNEVLATWPGPQTWLIPANKTVPFWIKGKHKNVAVRVTAHQLANKLCHATGFAIVSTSANYSHGKPARTYRETCQKFGRNVDFILPGRIGNRIKPTPIIDAETKKILRAG